MGNLATSKNLTILGVIQILQAVATAATALFDGNPSTSPDWNLLVTSVLAGIGLVFAKGQANTGGTVPATPEAAARVAQS